MGNSNLGHTARTEKTQRHKNSQLDKSFQWCCPRKDSSSLRCKVHTLIFQFATGMHLLRNSRAEKTRQYKSCQLDKWCWFPWCCPRKDSSNLHHKARAEKTWQHRNCQLDRWCWFPKCCPRMGSSSLHCKLDTTIVPCSTGMYPLHS